MLATTTGQSCQHDGIQRVRPTSQKLNLRHMSRPVLAFACEGAPAPWSNWNLGGIWLADKKSSLRENAKASVEGVCTHERGLACKRTGSCGLSAAASHRCPHRKRRVPHMTGPNPGVSLSNPWYNVHHIALGFSDSVEEFQWDCLPQFPLAVQILVIIGNRRAWTTQARPPRRITEVLDHDLYVRRQQMQPVSYEQFQPQSNNARLVRNSN